jgi:glutathione S-transferase
MAFNHEEDRPMLELYHNAFSTCSQKVRLVLAEKGLPFESREIDLLSGEQHAPDYVNLNPNHVVPTLVHDGAVLLESTLINEYLDEAFPETPLRPRDAKGRHGVRLWTKFLDESIHGPVAIVTFAIGPRMLLLQQPAAVREANIEAIPNPKARAARRSVIEHGVKAPEFADAFAQMVGLLDRIEATLGDRDWLSGQAYGLADAAVVPYVLRLDHLAMTPLLTAETRPALAAWYRRVQSRPSFETAVTKWIPDFVLEIMRTNGEAAWPEVAALHAGEPR